MVCDVRFRLMILTKFVVYICRKELQFPVCNILDSWHFRDGFNSNGSKITVLAKGGGERS